LTHFRFFRAIDEENLLNRIDNVMVETGVFLSLDMSVSHIMWFSDKVEARKLKRAQNNQNNQNRPR
jgi:hypothetical protein